MLSLLVVTLVSASPKVASPAWNVVDVKPELATFYAEQLAQALRAEGLTVTTAGDIATLLGAERQRELLGCNDNRSSCMAELASALGCDATLTVNLAKLGSSFRGLARLLSSRDGSVLSAVKIEATSEAALVDRLEAAAKELVAPLLGRPAPTVRNAPAAWWVPGAAGVVGLGAGAVLIGLAADRHAIVLGPDAAAAKRAAEEGASFQTAGWVAGSVGLAAVVGSVLWLTLGTTEVTPSVSVSPSGASVSVGGSF